MSRRPSVGRVVHYRPYPTADTPPLTPSCQAAIVVAVHGTGAEEAWFSPAERELAPGLLVTLCVFTLDGPRMHDAEQDESATANGGTWHWPEML